MEMNQQNMMPNFFDQQSNVNGYPSGYQPNQQMPMNSFSSPTSTTNPFMNNPAFRQQNGMSRFGMPEGENFNDMPPNSASSQQNFPNFMDPRMGGFDPRSRPGFDGSFKEGFSGMPGMEGFGGGNPSYGGKPRMPQDLAAAMFGNPAALAAYQRQRMSMFGQGRDNDFLSPTNPFGGFNPQQYAHQQRFTAALQRQAQEQMAQQQQQQHQMPGSRSGGDFARQFYGAGGSGSQGSTGPSGADPSAFGMMNQGQDNFPGAGGGSGFPGMRGGPRSEQQMKMEQAKMEHAKQAKLQEQQAKMEQHMKEQMEQAKLEQQQSQARMQDHQVNQSPGERGNSAGAGPPTMMNPPNMNQYDMSRFPGPGNGTGTPRPPFDQGSDSQRQAAMLAAAAVRAAAAASSRGRSGFNQAGPGTGGNFPYTQRGFAGNPELLGSPFGQQNMSSPSHDFPNMMSPSKDMSVRNLSQSPMSQGRLTPRNGNPPPYSPMPSSESMGAPPSMKGSYPNLTNTPKLVKPDEMSDGQMQGGAVRQGRQPQHADDVHGKDSSLKKENEDESFMNTPNCLQPNERSAKLSAPPTPMSAMSPSPSPHQDNLDIDALSPSWPQTPASPNTQKTLRARSSPHQFDQLSKIYDAIEDEEQRNFYDRYLAFMSVNGTPITSVPVIGKRPLDLYTLFRSVAERGGIQEVMEKRRFREIMRCLNLPAGNFALSYMVKDQYMKYLHTYEVKMKDVLMKQWKNSITLDHGLKPPSANVPTIALNDSMNSAMKDMKGSQAPPNHAFRPPSSQNWDSSASMPPISSSTGSSGPGQGPPQPYPPQRMPYFNQSGNMPGYPGQDMPPNYPPNNYGQYPQNPMFGPRGPMGSYGPMQQGMHPGMTPNESMSPGWPRGYPPRQGPPELFPEGLQRMPWSQSHHPMSAYSNRSPNFPGGKLRGPMPPVSRDPMEQMKMQQQQHQMKLQHQMQQSHHRPQFTHPPAPNKSLPAQQGQTPPVVRGPISPIVQQPKREMTFPPDSVESTKPVLKKRKKLTSKDLGPVEAWRIMMSLKSGLIAECTWAIDTLNVLLSDNNTITYFHLNQLPGLLDTLMDHYRRCLNDVFGLFSETEIALYPELEKSNEPKEKTVNNLLRALWVGVCKNAPSSYTASIASISVEGGYEEKLDGGRDFWQRGTGDNTTHIQMSFPTETVKVKAFPEEDRYHNDEIFAPPPKISKPNTTSRSSSPSVKSETKGLVTPIKQEKLPSASSTPRNSRPSTPSKLETAKKLVTNCVTNCLKRSLSSSTLPTIADLSKPPSSPANILERKLSSSMRNCIKSDSDSPDCGEYLGLEVLENLIKEYDEAAKESSLPDHPIIEKLRNDLDLNIQCDKKYLEDSKEFIGYLTRRLRRENRGHVKSDECNSKQNAPLLNCSDNKQSLLHRCLALSNVFRSLSYMSSNDPELCGHVGLQLIVGSILLHRHEHPVTDHAEFKLGQDDPTVSSQASLNTWNNSEVWWDTLKSVRENTLVMLSNIGGHMNLRTISKDRCKNIVTGLLHWISCPSSEGLDPMPTAPAQHALSPRRMAIETLAKVSINSSNIDPLVSCSSDAQLKDVSDVLVQVIASKRPIPTREFAIILLDNLSQSERFASLLARRKSSITNVIKFIQEAEKNTSNYLSQGGRVQPGLNAEDICGTSISLLRRSVNILLSVAKCACNASILLPHTDHLLALSTSQMIDTSVLALLSEVLFELSQHDNQRHK